jgi:hypothetical protein
MKVLTYKISGIMEIWNDGMTGSGTVGSTNGQSAVPSFQFQVSKSQYPKIPAFHYSVF